MENVHAQESQKWKKCSVPNREPAGMFCCQSVQFEPSWACGLLTRYNPVVSEAQLGGGFPQQWWLLLPPLDPPLFELRDLQPTK